MALKILIAEDSETNRMLFNMLLSRLGHDVDIVSNGEEAVRRFDMTRHDLVFLDLNMPVMDGFQTARQIAKKNANHVPVYAISGFAGGDVDKKLYDAGIRRCLIKPLDKDKLDGVIVECGLGRKAYTRDEHSEKIIPDDQHIPEKLLHTYARELRTRADACQRYSEQADLAGLKRETHTILALAQMLKIESLQTVSEELVSQCQAYDKKDKTPEDITTDLKSMIKPLRLGCQQAADLVMRRLAS